MKQTIYNFLKEKSYNILINEFSSERLLKVRPYREELPRYHRGYCHVYSDIVANMSDNFKVVPIVLICHDYPELVAHFILYDKDKDEYIDPVMSSREEIENYDYYYHEKIFPKIIEKSTSADVRLQSFKKIIGIFTAKYAKGFCSKIIFNIIKDRKIVSKIF